MIPIILESPYSGNVPLHLCYLRACMRDCLLRGEAPFASHGLYTQPGVLRDDVLAEREQGIAAGFVWREHAAYTVFYINLGWSAGMLRAKMHARERRIRELPADWYATQIGLDCGPTPTDWLESALPYFEDPADPAPP